MKSRVTLLNMASGLLLQIVTLISGLIIPRIILENFGSDVNGMIASIEQFLSYISLIEGGLTGVLMAKLYRPLVENNSDELSSVLSTGRNFYRKVGAIFFAYAFILALGFPLIRENDFSRFSIFALVIILSINLLIQYVLSITLRTLLISDKKGYIVSFSQIVIVIFNIIISLIVVKIYPQIHVLKLVSGCLYMIQPIIFSWYVHKHYDIYWSAPINNELIRNRWNGFAINIAAFIHNSTDITILTILTDFKIVSIYSVYNMVCGGIKQLVYSCLSGISQSVGQSYAKEDYAEVHFKMDLYEYIVFVLVTFFFSVTALLISPFVLLYTEGISDNNYYQPLFGVLLVISEVLYLVKLPHLNLSYAANKFKEITIPAYIEAGLNLMISMFCVKKYGLSGIVMGTIIGMMYRMIFHVYFTSKILPGRNQWIFYRKFMLFILSSIIGIVICMYAFPIKFLSPLQWILHGVIYSIIIAISILIISIIAFRKELGFFHSYLKKKSGTGD